MRVEVETQRRRLLSRSSRCRSYCRARLAPRRRDRWLRACAVCLHVFVLWLLRLCSAPVIAFCTRSKVSHTARTRVGDCGGTRNSIRDSYCLSSLRDPNRLLPLDGSTCALALEMVPRLDVCEATDEVIDSEVKLRLVRKRRRLWRIDQSFAQHTQPQTLRRLGSVHAAELGTRLKIRIS